VSQSERTRTTAFAKRKIDKIAYLAYGYTRPKRIRDSSLSVQIDDVVADAEINNGVVDAFQDDTNIVNFADDDIIDAAEHDDNDIENGSRKGEEEDIENTDDGISNYVENENNEDDEKDKKECVRKFKEAFNDIDNCYICSEQKGSINSFAKFPCHYHSLSHSACLIFWVKKYPRCPHCGQYAKFYIDNEGNEHDIRGFCGKFPLTSEEEEAREEIVRNKRAKKEARERADEKLNRDTLDRNQQVGMNKAGIPAQQCKERDRRHQVSSDRKSISINNNQHIGMDMDIEIEEEVDPAHNKAINQPLYGDAVSEIFDKEEDKDLDELSHYVSKTLKLDDYANNYEAPMGRSLNFLKKT
jgi:hypothetical protein